MLQRSNIPVLSAVSATLILFIHDQSPCKCFRSLNGSERGFVYGARDRKMSGAEAVFDPSNGCAEQEESVHGAVEVVE